MIQRERMQEYNIRTVAYDLVEESSITAAQGKHDYSILDAASAEARKA
jgi:hypothetical protein